MRVTEPAAPVAAAPPRSAPMRPWLRRGLIALGCALGIALNCYLELPSLSRVLPSDNDFMGFYAGAQLAGSRDLYSFEALLRAESRVSELPHFVPFVRWPVYAAAISPLRFFDYRPAYWIWQTISAAAVLLFVWFWPAPRKWMTAMACCWSLPLLNNFLVGQDVPVIMLALAVSMALFFRGRHFAAGCVFSLCLIKYNLFLPIPLLIAGKRLWKFGGGVAAGVGALVAMSFAVGGWSWPWRYAAMLRLPGTTPSYSGMPNLHGVFSGLPHGGLWEAAGTCATLAAVWLVIRRGEIAAAVSAALAGGLAVSYHAFFADASILAPACLLLLSRASGLPLRLAATLLLCPIAYLPFWMDSRFPPALLLSLPLLAMAAEQIRPRAKAEQPLPWKP